VNPGISRMNTYTTILYQVEQSVATITLNRPEKRNALDNRMLEELHDSILHAWKDRDVKAVLLTGSGKGFCAGQDLEAFETEVGEEVRGHLRQRYKPLIMALVEIPKPVIAAVNGAAAGAGASLALACDLRILADDAILIQVFSKIGLIPDSGSTWFLNRQLGYSRALQLAIEAEPIPASRCLELGLANRVAPAASLMREAHLWAERVAALPPLAVELTKQAIRQAGHLELTEAIDLEAELQQKAADSNDFREGVTAFREKRVPVFTGR